MAVVGSAEFEVRANRAQMKRDLADAKRELGGFVSDAEREVGGATGRIGGMVGKLGLAVSAVSAILAAGLAIVVKYGAASFEMANTLADSAQRIGIGTTALQEWQYVAKKTGQDAGQVSGALEEFATRAAQAAAGLNKGAKDAFHAIGFEPEDLRRFKDTESLIDAVTDRIGELKSEADRAAISEKLGLGPLTTALRDGSDEVARLRDEASALGFVMDDALIQKGAEAQGQLESLSDVIGVQMAEAFVGLSDEVIAFTGWIAQALKGLNDFIGSFRDFQQMNPSGNSANTAGMSFGYTSGLWDHLPWKRDTARRLHEGEAWASDNADDPALLRQTMAVDASRGGSGRTTPSGRTDLTPVVPRGPVDHSAEKAKRAAELEARRQERVEQEIFKAKERLLSVADEETMSAQQRFDLAQDRLKLERDARDAEIDSKTQRGEYKKAEADQIKAANASADALEDRALADRAFREIQNEQVAAQRVLVDFANQRLQLEADGALTETERRQVEKEILKLRQVERRRALERAANDQTASPAERAAAVKNLGQLDGMEAAENRSFSQSSDGAKMGLDAIDGTRERAKWVEDAADAYAEIDKLREEDKISEKEAAQAKAKINAELNEKRLQSTSDFFGNLATLANSSNHNLAAIGKAAGIAQATIDGVVAVQKAWASAPFPFNLPAVAATTVATAANVAAIAGIGFQSGGYTGDLPENQIAGSVHGQEYVFDAAATRRLGVGTLEALRAGAMSPADALTTPNLPGMSLPGASGSDLSRRQTNIDLRGAVMTADIYRDMKAMAAETHGRAVTDARRAAPRDSARRAKFRLGKNDE